MSIEERIERLEKLVNMILDNMSMRGPDGRAIDTQKHFQGYLREDDKE